MDRESREERKSQGWPTLADTSLAIDLLPCPRGRTVLASRRASVNGSRKNSFAVLHYHYPMPALAMYRERQYIAGFLVNVPTNTFKWIMNPQKYKPGTAMPELGVKAQAALDIAAFLYSLGDQQRITVLQQSSTHLQ